MRIRGDSANSNYAFRVGGGTSVSFVDADIQINGSSNAAIYSPNIWPADHDIVVDLSNVYIFSISSGGTGNVVNNLEDNKTCAENVSIVTFDNFVFGGTLAGSDVSPVPISNCN